VRSNDKARSGDAKIDGRNTFGCARNAMIIDRTQSRTYIDRGEKLAAATAAT
jgi:hypothetical protein